MAEITTLNTKIYHKTVNKPVATLASDSTNNSETKLVVTYDRALCSDAVGTLIADGANVKTLFAYDGTAGNYTSATYDFQTRSVTFVFTAAENTKKLTVANNSLYDQQGNEYGGNGADYYLYTAANTPKWSHSNSTDVAYSEIDGLVEVPEVYGKSEKIEKTTLSDANKRYLMGIKDPGDLALKFNYDNATATDNFRILKAYETNNTLVQFKIEYQDGTWVEFAAYVSVNIDSVKPNDIVKMTVTLTIDSEFTTTNI